jgi:hypothetical protein
VEKERRTSNKDRSVCEFRIDQKLIAWELKSENQRERMRSKKEGNKCPKVKKGNANPITCRGDPFGCETSSLPHFLDNRVTDGGEVVSLMRRPPFTPQEDSWYSFLLEAESSPGP